MQQAWIEALAMSGKDMAAGGRARGGFNGPRLVGACHGWWNGSEEAPCPCWSEANTVGNAAMTDNALPDAS